MPILAQGVAGTSATAIYGPIQGSNKTIRVKGLVISNESGSARTVSYGAGINGSTPGAAGTSQGKSVALGAAGSTTAIIDAVELEDFELGSGDYVWLSADAGSAIAYVLDGTVS